jgi:hypothetical protein
VVKGEVETLNRIFAAGFTAIKPASLLSSNCLPKSKRRC